MVDMPKKYKETTIQGGKYSILYLIFGFEEFCLLKSKHKIKKKTPIVKAYILYFFILKSKSFL